MISSGPNCIGGDSILFVIATIQDKNLSIMCGGMKRLFLLLQYRAIVLEASPINRKYRTENNSQGGFFGKNKY